MTYRLLPCLWISALLVACDKQGGAGNASSGDSAQPGATRASRTARQDLPGRQTDLRQALAEAKKNPVPEERDKAIVEVARAAIETNPNLVAEAIRHLTPDHPEKALLVKEMVARLMQDDPAAATAWVASLESARDRALAGGEIAIQTAAADPARAAALLAESGMTGPEFDQVAVQVLESWTNQTPEDAAAWVLRFPPGTSRDSAVKTLVTRWVQGDAGAAFSWLSKLSNPAVRKEASLNMAHALVDNPDFIRESMLQQADPAMRTDLEQQIEQIVEDSRDKSEPEPEPEPAPEAVPEPAPEAVQEPLPEQVPEPMPEVAPEEEPETEPEMVPEEEADEAMDEDEER
jgi:hypothetical protein